MPDSKELRLRMSKVRQRMKAFGIRAFLGSNPKDLMYLSGKEQGVIYVTMSSSTLFLPEIFHNLYIRTYMMGGYPHEIVKIRKGAISGHIGKSKAKKMGASQGIEQIVKKAGKIPVLMEPVLEARMIKTANEIRMLKKAAKMAKGAMEYANEIIGDGMTEILTASRIQHRLYELGSEGPAFGSGLLLSSGARSADIHARPSNKAISKGPVVVDLGALVGGYHSDMTRTLALGSLSKRQKEIICLVRQAQKNALDMSYPGISSAKLQKSVEEFLKDNGQKLHHRLGHGVGLDIHEMPRFGEKRLSRLYEGTVFTIEPGVYIPLSFGARHEDTFLMTRNGPKSLTS